TSEGMWWLGPPLASGRTGIDLSDPACVAPAMTYWYNGNLPDGQGVSVYFFSTWHGFQWAAGQGGQAAAWEQRTVDLTPFRGQSGRPVFWVFGNANTNGTGAYIDDISIDN